MTTTIRCTLSAAEDFGRESHDITVNLRSGVVSVPAEVLERLSHDDQRVADAARRDVYAAANEALETHHRVTDALDSDAPRALMADPLRRLLRRPASALRPFPSNRELAKSAVQETARQLRRLRKTVIEGDVEGFSHDLQQAQSAAAWDDAAHAIVRGVVGAIAMPPDGMGRERIAALLVETRATLLQMHGESLL